MRNRMTTQLQWSVPYCHPLVFAIALTFALGSDRSIAQDNPAGAFEMPAGALLKAAPEFSKWTVTFDYPSRQGTNPPPLTGDETHQVSVTKTGKIVSEDVVDGRGCHLETWYFGDQQYRKPHGKNVWYLSVPARHDSPVDPDYTPLPANGFRDWEWVGKDSFVGTMALDDGKWLVFVPGGAKTMDLTNPARIRERLAALPVVAYVNAETRLPHLLRAGGVTQRFLFGAPPAGIQTPPPDLVEQIKKGEEARSRLLQHAPRPY